MKIIKLALLIAISTSLLSGCGFFRKVRDNVKKDRQENVIPRPTTPVVNYPPATSFRANHHVGIVESGRFHPAPSAGIVSNGIPVAALSAKEQAIVMRAVEDTNILRREKGLPDVVYDSKIGAYAQVRAHEIVRKFAHTRPDGQSYSVGLTGGSYSGENIAAGYSSPDSTVLKQWRNSSGHYANIINPEYRRIGIGFVHVPGSEYGYYWVQVFGDDNISSRYYFSDSTNQPPNMTGQIAAQVQFHDGQIDLGDAPIRVNNATHAFRSGEVTHRIYANARSYSQGSYEAVIQDPKDTPFSYQTFGEVVNANGVPVQYVNIGQSTIPNDSTNLSATYHGASLGNLNQDSHVYANVTAQVEFGMEKTMDIQFTNSQMALHDIGQRNKAEPARQAADLDFNAHLTWQNDAGKFSGGGVSARFYGPNGEEMGGQFNRQVIDGTYEGVFGLRKAQ